MPKVSISVARFSSLLTSLCFFCQPYPARAEEAYIGLVTYQSGKWTMTDRSKKTAAVNQYSAIPNGALLRAESENSDIEIQLTDRSTITRHGNKLADKAIELKREPDGFFDKIFRIVQEQPQAFVTTMARGSNSLVDAVVVLNAKEVDLSAVFKEMQPGNFLFILVPKNGKNDNPRPQRFTATVAKGAKTSTPLPGIQPGLYELKTIEVVDEQERPVQKCWVAIVSKENATEASKKWQEALNKTKDWKDRPNACSRSCFLKAVLFSLARVNQAKS